MQAEKLSDELASLRIAADPRKKRSLFPWVGGALLLPIASGSFLLAGPRLEAAFFKTEVKATEILSLSPATVATEVTAGGYVVPQRLSRVGSRAEGRIARVLVEEGQRVARDDLLIVLDDAELKQAVLAGSARLHSHDAEAARQQAELADLERKLAREKALVEAGVSGRATMEDLAAQAGVLAQSAKAARADRDAARAELEVLKARLADLSIVAPIDGTVLTKPPQPGEIVSPSAAPFLEIADFASLMVEAEVPESRLAKVRIGGACEIMLDAQPSQRHRGVVAEISPLVNRAKATVVVKIAFAGEANGVLPNMAARAFILDSAEGADQIGQPPKTVVPSSAIAERDGAQVVFVIDGDRVRMTNIEVGAPFGPGFELLEGPPPGTRLVQHPPAALSEGHRIKEKSHD